MCATRSVPLLVVELLLVAVYLASHAWSLRKNVAALSEVARQELSRIADDESAVIEQQLGQVASLAEVPAPADDGSRWEGLLAHDQRTASACGCSRAGRSRPGTTTAAPRCSGHRARGRDPSDFERLERLATVDPLLRDVTLANPLIVQSYLNTRDSLTRIWPWIDAAAVFDPEYQRRGIQLLLRGGCPP